LVISLGNEQIRLGKEQDSNTINSSVLLYACQSLIRDVYMQ